MKITLARDNIQEKDGGVVSADKVIRSGIAVAAFSGNVTRWEAMGLASVDNIIR